MGEEEAEGLSPEKMYPGMEFVHGHVLIFLLASVGVLAVILLAFTIALFSLPETVAGPYWDPSKPPQLQSGWPVTNAALRLGTACSALCIILCTLWPTSQREHAYLVGCLLAALSLVCWVCFGLDVSALTEAAGRACPPGLQCTFAPYYTTVVFDAMCALVAEAYLIREYIFHHAKSTIQLPKIDVDSVFANNIPPPAYAAPQIDGPPLRPHIGVEVLEILHPDTLERCVTVVNVNQGGPCDKAGIRVGDIISTWDYVPIQSKQDLMEQVLATPIHSVVMVYLLRTVSVQEDLQKRWEPRKKTETVSVWVTVCGLPV